MKAFCDPDRQYLVTPDNPADLEDETEEEHYDASEYLVQEHGIVDSGAASLLHSYTLSPAISAETLWLRL